MRKNILTALLCMILTVPAFAQQEESCANCTEASANCKECPEHQPCVSCENSETAEHQTCTGSCQGSNSNCHHGNGACKHNEGNCLHGNTSCTSGQTVPELPESNVSQKMTQAEKAHNAEVNDSWGGAITIIAMCIVVSALVILSILFLIFGKISKSLLSRNKKTAAEKSVHSNPEDHDHSQVDSGEVIAAIAMALSEHFGEGHDMEETILTIRRLNRAYSPWNSKLYNLRQLPELHKQAPSRSAF